MLKVKRIVCEIKKIVGNKKKVCGSKKKRLLEPLSRL